MNISTLLSISRPRFWIYLFGPFLLGISIAYPISSLISYLQIILIGLLFLWPLNFVVYGINDIFDYDTDLNNPKKTSYESLLSPDKHLQVLYLSFGISLLSLLISYTFSNIYVTSALLVFLFLGIFYSAPPIRAKAKPFLDSTFNVLYILPGIVGFLIFNDFTELHWNLVLAGSLWSMAMHLYSAVPDIEADQKAHIKTSATVLKFSNSLILCGILYLIAGLILYTYIPILGLILAGLYICMIIMSLHKGTKKIFEIYKIFPILNTLAGFSIFVAIILSK
jgi:4-hydroxybenzoate polyprenyltransferase